jgi:Leucine-rich repeat (LRR) protein
MSQLQRALESVDLYLGEPIWSKISIKLAAVSIGCVVGVSAGAWLLFSSGKFGPEKKVSESVERPIASGEDTQHAKVAGPAAKADDPSFNIANVVSWRPNLKEVFADKNATEINLNRADISGADLAPITSMTKLIRLDLEGAAVNDGVIPYISKVPSLKVLILSNTDITGKGLLALGPMPNLEHLQLVCSACGSGSEEFKCLPQLKLLIMPASDFTDKDAAPLAHLRHLQHLYLNGNNVSDATVKYIADLPLVVLNISSTKITDASLALLSRCKSLQQLHVSKTGVTDEGVKSLSGLKLLVLDLGATKITEKCVSSLSRIKTLKELHCDGTRMTAIGYRNLKSALPDCAINSPNSGVGAAKALLLPVLDRAGAVSHP